MKELEPNFHCKFKINITCLMDCSLERGNIEEKIYAVRERTRRARGQIRFRGSKWKYLDKYSIEIATVFLWTQVVH